MPILGSATAAASSTPDSLPSIESSLPSVRRLAKNMASNATGSRVSSSSRGSDASADTAVTATHPATSTMSAEHQRTFDAFLYPADSYENGVYWAALPRKERAKFISRTQGEESRHEWAGIWADFKSDPLLPLIKYWRAYVLP